MAALIDIERSTIFGGVVVIECGCQCHGMGSTFAECDIPGGCGHLHEFRDEFADRRCAQGSRCRSYVRLDDDARTKVGVVVDRPRTLCDRDVDVVRSAIAELPQDYTDLNMLLGKTYARVLGTSVSGTRELPVPVRLHIEELQAQIVHEVLSCVEVVADEIGSTWDSNTARISPPHAAITKACRLLAGAHTTLLALPELLLCEWQDETVERHVHRLRGTHYRPGGGTTTSATVHRGRYVTVERTGVETAQSLLALHQRCEGVLGKLEHINRLPAPCPRCQRTSLIRPDGLEVITCTHCHRRYTWSEYDLLCNALAVRADAA